MDSGTLSRNFDIKCLGTHQKINKKSYYLAFNSYFQNNFPAVKLINSFSGKNGPDGDWMRKMDKDSNHYFNPINNTGDAISICIAKYKKASFHLKNKNMKNAAKEIAYMAHYAIDALSPFHHYGKPIQNVEDYENWFDPYYDCGILSKKHLKAEIGFFLKNLIKDFLPGQIYTINNTEKFIQRFASNIFQLKIVNLYETGKKREADILTYTKVIPIMISVVGSLYRRLYSESVNI